MGRILCLDIGERQTGVALSDPTKTIGQGFSTINHRDHNQLLAALRPIVAENEVELILVGLPLSASGRPSTRSESLRKLAPRIGSLLNLPVVLFDERYSTVRANQILEDTYGRSARRLKPPATGRSRKRKRAVDRIAAAIILQDYLASLRESRD